MARLPSVVDAVTPFPALQHAASPMGTAPVTGILSGPPNPWSDCPLSMDDANADFGGDTKAMSMWSGRSVGQVRSAQPAAEIVRQFNAEAEAILKRLGLRQLFAKWR